MKRLLVCAAFALALGGCDSATAPERIPATIEIKRAVVAMDTVCVSRTFSASGPGACFRWEIRPAQSARVGVTPSR